MERCPPGRPHKVRSFERATANQPLADGPVHLPCSAADRPRLSGGLHGRHSRSYHRLWPLCQPVLGSVLEVVRAAIGAYGPPQEISPTTAASTSPGGAEAPSAGNWRAGHPADRGQAQRPQTLGKIERFWGTLMAGVHRNGRFLDLEERSPPLATSSTITTSNARIRGSRAWSRPIGSSAPRRKVLRTLRERWR